MKWWKSELVLLVILSVAWAAPAPFADDVEESLRLPKTSMPINYEINIRTNAHYGVRSFSGAVKILVEITKDTNVITLHNRELSVQSVKVTDNSGSGVALDLSTSYNVAKDFMNIEVTTRELLEGEKLLVEIAFSGQMRLDMTGFYMSSYRDGEEIR